MSAAVKFSSPTSKWNKVQRSCYSNTELSLIWMMTLYQLHHIHNTKLHVFLYTLLYTYHIIIFMHTTMYCTMLHQRIIYSASKGECWKTAPTPVPSGSMLTVCQSLNLTLYTCGVEFMI